MRAAVREEEIPGTSANYHVNFPRYNWCWKLALVNGRWRLSSVYLVVRFKYPFKNFVSALIVHFSFGRISPAEQTS